MSKLKTAGELRGFLAEVLIGIQNGSIDTNKANAIAKVSAQINQSLAVEVSTALQMEKMGGGKPVAGSMVIAHHDNDVEQIAAPAANIAAPPKPPVAVTGFRDAGEKVWCDQCDLNVTPGQAVSCKSPFCKAKAAA